MSVPSTPLLSELAPHRLRPLIMPIRSLPELGFAGFEVLTRGPSGTVLEMPEDFFHEATLQGCSDEVDRRCIRQALLLASSLPVGMPVFINMYADTMLDPGFADWLEGMVAFSGCAPESIVIEIHERINSYEIPALFSAVRILRDAGFQIALDDVVLLTDDVPLLTLNPEYVKVDRSVLLGMPRKRAEEQIRDFMDLCRDVNAHLIVEGIERPEHVDLAQKCGVRYGQGFHLGRPAEAMCYVSQNGMAAV
jgi:EAL domain-containing protein (putative c-di-GMP-specific phosphodiesterase class I)